MAALITRVEPVNPPHQGPDRARQAETNDMAGCGLVVSVLFIGGLVDSERMRASRHHHRAHG